MRNEQLREKLAELEHEQWWSWSRSLAEKDRLTQATVKRWSELWHPYSELTEEQKDEDRVWADRVLQILEGNEMEEQWERIVLGSGRLAQAITVCQDGRTFLMPFIMWRAIGSPRRVGFERILGESQLLGIIPIGATPTYIAEQTQFANSRKCSVRGVGRPVSFSAACLHGRYAPLPGRYEAELRQAHEGSMIVVDFSRRV